ncbi:uncharacterized protein [Branchiostoma lanceolatum]|uniref:uncharacterized protein n=1 Tax=Branchiostoma lanceolatum TaxID=7740 RepID=UPI0034514CF2
MRTRPVLLLCVFVAVVRQVTGTTLVLTPDEATAASCTEWEANADNVTGLATDCSRRNFSAVPTNVSSSVVVLDLAHNRLFFLTRDSFSGLARLKVLSLSYNQIRTIEHGSFSDLSELSELYLDHNGISSIANGFFTGLSWLENVGLSFNRIAYIEDSALDEVGTTLKQLELGNNYLGRLLSLEKSYRIFQQLENLTHLDLSNNGIYDFRSDVLRSQSNIWSMNLSGNALRDKSLFIEVQNVHNHSGEFMYVQRTSVFHGSSSLKSLDISHNRFQLCCEAYNGLTNLAYLDLRSNDVSYIEPENITKALPNLNELHLRGNPFDCSCRAAPFFRWVDDSVVDTDILNWTCQRPPSVAEAKVAELDIRGCGQDLKYNVLLTAFIPICVIAIFAIGAVIFYRRAKRANFSKIEAFENIELEDRKYDVFICYSSHDADWVHRSLLPHLDSLHVEYCIHLRDFAPGETIVENIVYAIEQSCQVIVVISGNFLHSEWCTFELQMAEHRHFTTGEKYIIPILLDEVPVNTMPKSLRYLLATKTYIEWKGRGEEEDLFWRRLGKALKSRLPIKRTNNDAIYMEKEATIMPESPTSTPKHRSDTVNEDVEPENNDDHETCVTLDDTPKETRTTDQTIDTTRADEGPCFDNNPPFDCQTVCSSEAYTDNPVVEDVNLTKTRRLTLATFFAGMFEKGRHVFFSTLFRFKYTKTSLHQKVHRSASAAELFLPTVLHESYTEKHAHISCCHEEPIYQNSWFLYHAIQTRAKEPLPPVPDVQLEDTSLSIPEPQTTIVHMVAIEHSLSPTPVYEEIPYHGTERSIAPYQENVEGIQVVQQPRLNVVTSSLASGIFDSDGGHLVIEGTGVRLFIPPGAIKSSVEQQVTISISSDECDKPNLTEGQARISPVIRCSPHGIAFEKSVALSFPHTGEVSKGKLIHPLITNTDQGQQAGYEDMKKDHGAYAIVRKTDCVVFLDHFTGVTLVEESPCPDEGAKGDSGNDDSTDKPLYAIPFWTLTSSGDVMVRVRLCQKRNDAKQTAYEEEQPCGSRPCDGPPVTLYVPVTNGTKARVQVVMDSVRAGWASVDGLEKVIDCRRIFTDDEVQQCSFLLEKSSDDGHDSNRFRCRLQIIPEGNEDVQTTFVSVLTDEPPAPRKQDFAVRPKRPSCLPAWVRKELCRLLDPSNPKGNDWRMLSCELNLQLDSFDIQLFQEHSDKRSPTFQILSLFELDYGHLPQVQQLHALRKVLSEPPMGRPDASQLVEGIISQQFEEDAASTPTTRHQHQHYNPVTPNAMSRLTDDRYYSPYAAPCAVHPKHTRNMLQITDSSIPSVQQDATYRDEAPEEAAMMKNHQQQTMDKQTYKQESQASSTAASRPLKVPGTNASLDTDHFENITSQIEDTHSHVDAAASTKRMQVTKCDDQRITVEEAQVTSPSPVDVPSSEDAPNWTDDKKLKNKHDVVDHDLREKGLTKRMATMHLSKEEESVSLLDETDA